MHLAPQYL